MTTDPKGVAALARSIGPGHFIALTLVVLIWFGADRVEGRLQRLELSVAELTAAVNRNTDHQDARFREFQESQSRLYADLLRAVERSTSMSAAVCLATANGVDEARRICEQAMME